MKYFLQIHSYSLRDENNELVIMEEPMELEAETEETGEEFVLLVGPGNPILTPKKPRI